MVVFWQIWLYEIYRGILLICQNTTMRAHEAWIKRHSVLCKKISAPSAVCFNFPFVRKKPLGTPAFVKLVYYIHMSQWDNKYTHWGLVTHICVSEMGHNRSGLLFGTKPLLEPLMICCQSVPNRFQWYSNQYTNVSFQRNAYKYVVCKTWAIMFNPRCLLLARNIPIHPPT